jgi:hypothetical protein
MMYVEQYAQQRMNEQQADREQEWRRIAEHWNQDARTIGASKWAIVRLFDRIMDRRAARSLTRLPDGAQPLGSVDQTHSDGFHDSTTDTGTVADASATCATQHEPLWTEGSIVGRFAECAGQSSKATGSVDDRQHKELAATR